MPSHWSDIGLPVHSQNVYKRYGPEALRSGKRFKIVHGTYVRWELGDGAELWLQLYQQDGIDCVGMNPHFSGHTSIPVTLTHRFIHDKYSPLTGGFQGYTRVQLGEGIERISFVFDVPNHRLYEAVKLPIHTVVQLTAFTDALVVYSSENEYYAKHKDKRKLSPTSFFPSGLAGVKQPEIRPQALASFGGHVLQARLVANPTSRKKFYWATLRTLIGELDLVADPKYFEQPLVEGNVVWGSFYLSGLLLDVSERREM
jgi:hypothetical protein